MQYQFLYSIVIPHYNNSTLLKRMLDSIPSRNDIQVIVVDDGSCVEEQEQLKKLQHKNLEVYFSLKNMGGGYARNEGFSHVKGRWFIGCDADDFFEKNAFDILDKYKDSDLDCLCYCIKCVDEISLKPIGRFIRSDVSVREFLKQKTAKTLSLFKFRNYEPWNKMLSVDFIRRNNIKWENCRINIDVMFGLQVGLREKSFHVIPDELYNLVFTDNSITRKKKSIEREFEFYLQVMKRNVVYKYLGLGYPLYRPEFLYIPFLLKKRGFKDLLAFYKYRKQNYNRVLEARSAYLPILEGVDKKSLFIVK